MERQKGFTLIEMVVVIAILGVLAAVAVPLITNYIGDARGKSYDADREVIQAAVDAYYSASDNDRYTGKRQYPIMGMAKTGGTFYQADVDVIAETILAADIDGNPLGGTAGGSPVWVDDDNGLRDADEEVLNDEDTAATVAAWHTVGVTRGGTAYRVDTRDYLIDFDELLDAGLLKRVPSSASADNKPSGSTNTYDGSYSWYVDSNGRVQSLHYYLPEAASTGFQEAYP